MSAQYGGSEYAAPNHSEGPEEINALFTPPAKLQNSEVSGL